MKKILFLFVLAGIIACNTEQPVVEEVVVEEVVVEEVPVEKADSVAVAEASPE